MALCSKDANLNTCWSHALDQLPHFSAPLSLLPGPKHPIFHGFQFFWMFKELFVFIINSQVYWPPGVRDSLVYSPPWSHDCQCIHHLGVVLDTRDFFKPILMSIQQPLKVGYFSYLGACDLCLKKCLTQDILIDSLMSSSPGSRLQIRVTPRTSEKILNHF